MNRKVRLMKGKSFLKKQTLRLRLQGAARKQSSFLEKKMATHSSILAQRIPWTEERGGLQSMGQQRVGQAEIFYYKKFFKNRKDKEKKLVTVSTDTSFKEFCHKGNEKNKAMANTILFDPQ